MVTLTSQQIPTDNVHHSESETTVNVDGNTIGAGTLYITENFVLWLNTNGQGFQLEYRDIGLHAISRDLSSFPHAHLLLHYEGKLPGLVSQNAAVEDDEDEEEEMEYRQDAEDGTLVDIRFIPQNPEVLDAMFKAMSDCQLLHPDPEDDCVSADEEEFDDAEENGEEDAQDGDGAYTSVYNTDGYFTGEEGFDHLTEEGRANLQRMNNMLLQQQIGQGDSDLSARTSQITISNGHHNPDDDNPDQFHDAEDMN